MNERYDTAYRLGGEPALAELAHADKLTEVTCPICLGVGKEKPGRVVTVTCRRCLGKRNLIVASRMDWINTGQLVTRYELRVPT